jgi:hypothetical protein
MKPKDAESLDIQNLQNKLKFEKAISIKLKSILSGEQDNSQPFSSEMESEKTFRNVT